LLLAIIGLIVGSGLIISFLVTYPYSQVLCAGAATHAENLSHQIVLQAAVSGRDEVGRLSASFNEMASRIQDYTRRLEDKTAELDRAYQQTCNSFAIVQEVGSKISLHDVCVYLIRRFQEVVACRRMAMLIFLENKKNVIAVSESGSAALTGDLFDTASAAVERLDDTAFLKPDAPRPPLVPAEFDSSKRLVIAPIRHEEKLLGALVIGCSGECVCNRKGLDVISLIFRQTAGTLRRAALQEEEIRDLQERVESSAEFSGIIGKDPQMRIIYKLIEDTAPTDATVLIQGESGTGKELVAEAIHHLSPRRDKPFIVINARPSRQRCSKASFSDMKKALSPEPSAKKPGASSRPMGAPFSWMKSAKSPHPPRSGFCGCFKPRTSSASGEKRPSISTCEYSRPRTATSLKRFATETSARTSTAA
jgi:two-component system response regulator HydG